MGWGRGILPDRQTKIKSFSQLADENWAPSALDANIALGR